VPLAPAEQLTESGFDWPEDIAERLAGFLAAYGLAEPAAISKARVGHSRERSSAGCLRHKV
jgi:hypothetical protein